MFILGLGTASPAKRYSQEECWQALESSEQIRGLTLRSRAILKKVLRGNNGIATRNLALDPLEDAFKVGPDVLHERFSTHAPALATTAAQRALANSRLPAHDIDALIISTCTGYMCPGLTSYVAERIGLRPDTILLDLVGQGCGAALPNLRTGEALIASGRCRKVLSICVEVCSAAFYLDDDPGVLISACLFGDGAGAAVLSNAPSPGARRIAWIASDSVTCPADRDFLRFEQRGGMLRNILRPEVPALAAGHFKSVIGKVLGQKNLSAKDINAWIVHAGGRDVLLALQEKMGLPSDAFCLSSQILHDHGNLSSPFVYFVLEEALKRKTPGGFWWLAAFGAGFSSHGALLEVE